MDFFFKKLIQEISNLSKMINSALVTSGIRAYVLHSRPQWSNCGQIEKLFFCAMTMLWESTAGTYWELGFSFHKVATVS